MVDDFGRDLLADASTTASLPVSGPRDDAPGAADPAVFAVGPPETEAPRESAGTGPAAEAASASAVLLQNLSQCMARWTLALAALKEQELARITSSPDGSDEHRMASAANATEVHQVNMQLLQDWNAIVAEHMRYSRPDLLDLLLQHGVLGTPYDPSWYLHCSGASSGRPTLADCFTYLEADATTEKNLVPVIKAFACIRMPPGWTAHNDLSLRRCFSNLSLQVIQCWKHPFYDHFVQLVNCERYGSLIQQHYPEIGDAIEQDALPKFDDCVNQLPLHYYSGVRQLADALDIHLQAAPITVGEIYENLIEITRVGLPHAAVVTTAVKIFLGAEFNRRGGFAKSGAQRPEVTGPFCVH
ncbi:unnamed protein product [Amoebophrya sp. A120]|nr:unnamed protein product [Amoebophrya sp. A120]|eukprot:GSA120T00022493001.1